MLIGILEEICSSKADACINGIGFMKGISYASHLQYLAPPCSLTCR